MNPINPRQDGRHVNTGGYGTVEGPTPVTTGINMAIGRAASRDTNRLSLSVENF